MLILILTSLLLALNAHSASVTLAWDASPTPDVSYRIKWGFASGALNQTHVVDAGQNLTITITEPWSPGSTIYFNVYAYNDAGESLPDGEVNWTVPLEVPTPTPTATPSPTPEPPSNLRILEAILTWLRQFFPTI